jgi:hypothetical protein
MLAATVRHAALTRHNDSWVASGWAHMLATASLSEMVPAWTIHHRDSWTWIVQRQGAEISRGGKAYRVEGLVLSQPDDR